MSIKFFSKNKSATPSTAQPVQGQGKTSTHDLIPIHDLDGEVLLKKNKDMVAVIRIEPVNLDLLSDKEKRQKISAYFGVINGITFPLQFLGLGRPVDLDTYLASLEDMKNKTESEVKKKLLAKYLQQAAALAGGGDKMERRYYFLLKEPKADGSYQEQKAELLNRARDFVNQMNSAGFACELCNFLEIRSMLQNYCQPTRAAFEKPQEYPGPIVPTIYNG